MDVAIDWRYGTLYILALCVGIVAIVIGQTNGGLAICLLAMDVLFHEWVHIFAAQISLIDIHKISVFGNSYVEFGLPYDMQEVPPWILTKVERILLTGFYFDAILWFFAIYTLWNSGTPAYSVIAAGLAIAWLFFNMQKGSDIRESLRIEKHLAATYK